MTILIDRTCPRLSARDGRGGRPTSTVERFESEDAHLFERLLTRDEVQERFGISKRYLETAICREEGPPFIKIGRGVRYRPLDILRWIEVRRTDPEDLNGCGT